jgi:hypothetical protein
MNDRREEMTVWHSFRHFVHLDHANAAIHTADVRYSPITFRLAELLDSMRPVAVPDDELSLQLLNEVLSHLGLYEEDPGR